MYFFLGVAVGIYIGTFYNCKPMIKILEGFLSNRLNLKKKD